MSSVLSACTRRGVGRCVVLFKLKGIMALSVEQRDTSQGSRQPLSPPTEHSTCTHRKQRAQKRSPSQPAQRRVASSLQMQHQGSSSSSASGLGSTSWAFRDQRGIEEVRVWEPLQEQSARQEARLWAAWGSAPGAFLTSGCVLRGWVRGREACSAGMLKPLASSRAASSVSCRQGEEVPLPAPGPGPPSPSISVCCGLSFSNSSFSLLVACGC